MRQIQDSSSNFFFISLSTCSNNATCTIHTPTRHEWYKRFKVHLSDSPIYHNLHPKALRSWRQRARRYKSRSSVKWLERNRSCWHLTRRSCLLSHFSFLYRKPTTDLKSKLLHLRIGFKCSDSSSSLCNKVLFILFSRSLIHSLLPRCTSFPWLKFH